MRPPFSATREGGQALPWYDCGFDFVQAADKRTAAAIGRVPLGAVHGPFASLEAARRDRLRRERENSQRRATKEGGSR